MDLGWSYRNTWRIMQSVVQFKHPHCLGPPNLQAFYSSAETVSVTDELISNSTLETPANHTGVWRLWKDKKKGNQKKKKNHKTTTTTTTKRWISVSTPPPIPGETSFHKTTTTTTTTNSVESPWAILNLFTTRFRPRVNSHYQRLWWHRHVVYLWRRLFFLR